MKGFLFFISLALVYFSYSQIYTDADTYSNMMSGAQVNHRSALSMFYNPAIHAVSDRGELGVGNTVYYPNSGIYDLELALTLRKNRSTFGVGLAQEGYKLFNTTTGRIHYALQLDSTWSLGVTAGIKSSDFYSNRVELPMFSVGVMKMLTKQLTLSMCVFGQQTYLFKEDMDRGILYRWKIGGSYESLNKQFVVHLSAQYQRKMFIALCLYYRLSDRFHFFVSGKSAPVDYSFGARVKLNQLAILIGFQYNTTLGFSPSSVVEYAF